jgi:two-component system sensor histidine kinase FlrB
MFVMMEQEQQQELVDRLPVGVIVLDSQGLITFSNRYANQMLNKDLDGVNWIDVVHDVFSPRQDDGHEISLKDGRRVSLATTSLAPEPGQLITLYDVTLTRAYQSEMASRMRLVDIGKMAAKLAHQIRTPLATMLLNLSNLDTDALDTDKRHKFVKKIKSSIHELEQQVNDMLLYAKGGNTVVAEMSVQMLFDDVQGKLSDIIKETQTQFTVINNAQGISFKGNLESLSGSVQNLIQNSIQASGEQARVELTASVRDSFLEIAVTDHGEGIKDDELENITKPFYTTKSKGTGLGLSVVQAVIKAHFGEMKITSEHGKGTTIRLIIPVSHKGE